MQKVHIQNLRLYFSGNNLLYFTNYNGFTPEILGGLTVIFIRLPLPAVLA